MTSNVARRVTLVTGSTSGIGLDIACALAADGWTVALNGLGDASHVDAALSAVRQQCSGSAAHFHADMRDAAQVRRLVADVERAHGRLDLLVNNAGVQHIDRIEAFPSARWDEIVAVNLSAVFHATQAVLPGMQARGYGRIVNIASVHGLVASADKAAYVAAKHGVVGLTKVTALENATAGITCNAICPGWVRTPLVEAQIRLRMERGGISADDAIRLMLGEKEPTQRFTTTNEIADAVRFLVGPAAGNITGICLPMDGGWTAQ